MEQGVTAAPLRRWLGAHVRKSGTGMVTCPGHQQGQEFIPDSLSRALCLSGHISQAHTQIALILRKEKQLTLIKPLIHYDIYSIKVK